MRTFEYEGPLSLTATVRPLTRGRSDPTFVVDERRVLRASRTPDGPGTLRIRKLQEGQVEASAWGPGADWLIDRVPALLALDEPPVTDADFEAPLPKAIWEMAKACRGMRLARTERVFETLVPIVLEQLVTGLEGKRAWRHLVSAFREKAPGPVEDLWLPPSPEHIRSIPSDEFMSLGILRKQGLTLRRLAERAPRMEEAAHMTPADAYARLTALKGIGPWTAGSMQLYAMGHADAVIVGDYHLPNGIAWNLAGEDRADDDRMLELLQPFAGQRGRVQRWISNAGQGAPRYGARREIRAPHRPAWRPRRGG